MRNILSTVFCLIPMLFSPAAQSQVCDRGEQARSAAYGGATRPKIGLALGGGGARGSAHIGVLKALEEMQIPVDYVSGTSMGALIGAMYASGMDAKQMEKRLGEIDWDEMLSDDTERQKLTFRRKRDDDQDFITASLGYRDKAFILPEGALVGQKAELYFSRMTLENSWNDDFDHLPIPFRAVAADIVTGEEVVLKSGSLARAMRASMSIPGLFSPVELNDRLLVDGGIANNLPVKVLRDMGADIVIAVDVSSPRLQRDQINDVVDMIEQLSNLMVFNSTEDQRRSLRPTDFLITPALGTEVTAGDFDKSLDAMAIGYAAMQERADELARLKQKPEVWSDYRKRVDDCAEGRPVINFIRIVNDSGHDDDLILEYLNLWPGEPINFDEVEDSISRIYGLGGIRNARYEIIEANGDRGMVLTIEPDRRLPNEIEYGLTFFSDGLDNAINVRAGLLRRGFDQSGSEYRVTLQLGEEPELFAEYFRPLSPVSPWFINPRFKARQDSVKQFENGNAISELLVSRGEVELIGGRYLGNSNELSLGLVGGGGEAEVEIGPPVPVLKFNTGSLFLRCRHDSLDDLYFPHTGTLASVQYEVFRDGLGSDDDFEQFSVDYFTTRTVQDKHALQLGLTYRTTLDEDAPVYGIYRAGGFTQLSGLDFNEVSGQHYARLLGGYRYQLGESGFLPAYIGGTIEVGNTFDDRDEINFSNSLINGSLYFGYNSPIGPLYTGFGISEGSDYSFFVRLGDFLVDDD